MWYRIEWSDLYISDFGASQIKTVENCTNPGGPLEVGTKVKVYRPSEKKYWCGEIIRISARKADLDKEAPSDQPQTDVAELETDKFLTGLQERGQLTPAITKVLQRVDDAGTIGTLFNPMIHEVTSTCNNDSDEDVLDQLIQKFLTMKADGFNGQLWKDVLFKAPRKGDRLAFIGATLMTMFRDSGMQSAQPSKKAGKAKKKRKALADITTPQPKHRAKKHQKENIPPMKRSKKEDAKALERKQAREMMRHLMAQQNTTTERTTVTQHTNTEGLCNTTETDAQEGNTQDSITEMDIQHTTTETDTLITQNTSIVGLPSMTETDTQHANIQDSRAENDTQNSITETNTHTQNTSTETDTGHTANIQHTTAETQNTSSRTGIDIQVHTSTAVDSTHTVVSNTSNTSTTSSGGLLTQTTNILENIDSPQYAQSHQPTLYDSPHTHYRHNLPPQTHNSSYQNFEPTQIHPSSNHPQNWYTPSTLHMPHLQNLDMLTSSVNEIRYYVEQTYRDAAFIRQQLGFRNEQNSSFTQAVNEPYLTSTPARSQGSYSTQSFTQLLNEPCLTSGSTRCQGSYSKISEVAQMSARNAESPAKAVRTLAMSAFGVEILKKSTVSGISTTRSSQEKLDPLILKEIQDFMACHFKVTRSYVNQIIGNKIRELRRDRRMDLP